MIKFFFIILILILSTHSVSIGSCLKYSPDGQSCQSCITNYHLYQGSCYVDILGCNQYQFGNICHQCDKNYILVNNMCCDMVCMSKIFSKFKKQVKQDALTNNTQILNELIPFAQTQYLKNSSGRLVAIQVKEYQQAKRFFLLYEFYENEFYSKRLIVDYVVNKKKYIIIDWSLVNNSWKYANVQWSQVEDDAIILLFYPNLYPKTQNYNSIVARKALLSEVDQYEIATLIDTKMLIRILYSYQLQQVILKQAASTQPLIIASATPTDNQTANPSTANTSTITSTTSTGQSPPNNSSTNQTSNNVTAQSSLITFRAYQLKYVGQDILGQLDVNEPLIKAYELVKAYPNWNHSLTLVVQSAKIPNVLQFQIIGQNKHIGSIFKFTIKYNIPTTQAFLIAFNQQTVSITTTTSTTPTAPVSSTQITSTNSSTSSNPSISSTVPTVSLTENQVYVIEQGCTTHTYYISPFSPDIEAVANQLKSIRQQAILGSISSQTPFIAGPSLVLRRLVISDNCLDSNYKQVAYVEGDTLTTKQYFTYYFEVQTPTKNWYYLGNKNKTQTTSVYSSPYSYPIYISDPSFILYPSASLYYQTGVSANYSNNLTSSQQTIFGGLTAVANSQKDRNMGKMYRFAIDGIDSNSLKYRMTGWKVLETPAGLQLNSQMISLLCEQGMITETQIIGSSGPTSKDSTNNITDSQNTTTLSPEQIVSTTISTSVLGDQTVTTTNTETFLNEDEILKKIMQWLLLQKQVTKNYQLKSLKISQYNQALEYHIIMVEKNLLGVVNFAPISQIRAVVVYDKVPKENTLISFQIIQISLSGTDNGSSTSTNQVHSNIPQIPNDEYVIVDLTKSEQDYKPVSTTDNTAGNQSSPSTSTSNTSSNPTTTNQSGTLLPNTSDTQNSTNTTRAIQNNVSQVINNSEINQQQRIKQILDIIMKKLELQYKIAVPELTQALKQINQAQKTIKLTLVVLSKELNKNYSVIAIAHLNTQDDPAIQSVKQITSQIIQKLTPDTSSNPSTKTCNTTINSSGQSVCVQQSTSPQADISVLNPATTTSQQTQNNNSITTSPSNNPLSTQQTSTTQQTQTAQTQQPSIPVAQMIEQKSFEETVQLDGQIRKIYVNPVIQDLSEDIKTIIEKIKSQQLELQKSQQILQTPEIKVKAIQLAATTIYVHYAITIKIIYKISVVLRRYYLIVSLNNSGASSNIPTTNQIYMGHEDLPINYDNTLKQNRVFKDLLSIPSQPTPQLTGSVSVSYPEYSFVINYLNKLYKTTFIISNVVYYRYRVFPTGNYVKVTLKNDSIVGNIHIATNIQSPQTPQLLNWHQQTINTITQTTSTISQTKTTENTTQKQAPWSDGSKDTQSSTTTGTVNNQNKTDPNSIIEVVAPQILINQHQQTSPSSVIISLSLQQKLGQVLRYLSVNKAQQLSGGSLEQYAATQQKSTTGTVNAIQFDLYFLKFISDTLLRQFICSVVRHQVDGKINIALFLSNDIHLSQPKQTTITDNSSLTPTITQNNTSEAMTPQTNNTAAVIEAQVKQQQINLNQNVIIVDPNSINYPEAISLINQDSMATQFDNPVDLNNISTKVQDIVKFIRAKYVTIKGTPILKIFKITQKANVQRYRIYFFKQQTSNNYSIYRCILDYNTELVQTKFIVISFNLYANNHQLLISPEVSDLSLKDDTDIAYGYSTINLETISTNDNIQNVLKHLNVKYRDIVLFKNIAKIQELKLLDGRINYKIVYKDPQTLSQFKFIIFYQPQLSKVLVLNSVNLPHHSQYNQLTSEQQKSDSSFNLVRSYLNSIHPEMNGLTIKSVSKAIQASYSEYQLIFESKNKKYKSAIRVSSNNVDLNEINFSQIMEISLDHYKLDKFDQMFIMSYQKISEQEIKVNSKIRILLNYLYNNKKINIQDIFLGAAYKPYGLGFLYKLFFQVGAKKQLTAVQIYIEAYSDKISLKSLTNVGFVQDLLSVNLEEQISKKMMEMIKEKSIFKDFVIENIMAKDFLYGTLYKIKLNTKNGAFNIYAYHDHSTQEITILLIEFQLEKDECTYSEGVCVQCSSEYLRVFNNKCIKAIKNCVKYDGNNENVCEQCDGVSEKVSGMCIQKISCNGLCQKIQL